MYILVIYWALPAQVRILPSTNFFFYSIFFFTLLSFPSPSPPPPPPPFFFFFFMTVQISSSIPNPLTLTLFYSLAFFLFPSIHSIPFHSLYSLPFTLFPSIHSIPFHSLYSLPFSLFPFSPPLTFPTLSYYLSTFPLLFGQSYFIVNLVRYVAIPNAQADSCLQAHETLGYWHVIFESKAICTPSSWRSSTVHLFFQ